MTSFHLRRCVFRARETACLSILAFCALSACSGGGGKQALPPVGPGYYAQTRAVCGLLNSGDLEAALGRDYQEGVDRPTNALAGITAITKCIYAPAGSKGGANLATVTSGVVYAYGDQIFAQARRARKSLGPREIAGLGTQAFWTQAADELLALAKGKVFGLTVHGDGTEPNYAAQERARRLAASALSRLR